MYRFPSLGLGHYTLTATKPGFETYKQENITLAAEETRTVPLVLKVGQTQETVTVTTEAAAVQLSESKIASDITSKEITELPISGRNIFNLVSQTPGVTGIGQGRARAAPLTTTSSAWSMAGKPTPTASAGTPTPSTWIIPTPPAIPIRASIT